MDALPRKFKKENKTFGLLFEDEIRNLDKCFKPKENFKKGNGEAIFVLGGAKLKTKTVLMKTFLEKYDRIIVGGVLANTFYKELGFEIGKSKVENLENDIDFNFKEISENKNFFLPNIVIVKNRNGKIFEKEITEISKNDTILDISPSAFFEIEDELKNASFVLFNGPVGYYESGFSDGTEYLLNIFDSENNFFVAGGGNTVSLIRKLGLSKNADFLSTGGGAMIDYLKDKKLAGIESIEK
jgi:phosphoglycerate kinase